MVENVMAQFQRNPTRTGWAALAQDLSRFADICAVGEQQECTACLSA